MKLPLEIELGRSCGRLFWSLQNRYNALLKPLGVTIEQLRLLMLISYNEGEDQQFFANETLKVKSAIATLLEKMGKEGLVIRIVDENDTRNKKVYLTDKGKVLTEKGKKILINELKKILKHKDANKIEVMIQTMQELTEELL